MATSKSQATPVQRRAFSINEACVVLNICRATAYTMMRSGALRYVEYGGRRHIPADAVEALVRGELPDQAQPKPAPRRRRGATA
jgi:excisionase family DNA binding protein